MLVWSNNFATKIESVDVQHKRLFDLLNGLSAAISHGQPDQAMIDKILKGLMIYADQHFADEEILMLHSHIDARHVNIHKMEHKSFVYDIHTMWEHLSSEDDLVEISEKLVSFVTSWLTYHILGIDQVMAAQIFAIQQGATPEEAYEARHTVKYDSETAHMMLDSVLDLWRMTMERCHKLEAKLAALKP